MTSEALERHIATGAATFGGPPDRIRVDEAMVAGVYSLGRGKDWEVIVPFGPWAGRVDRFGTSPEFNEIPVVGLR
jgi:hypothetical protein